jgi:uncharacterized membrane protein YfcA
LNPTTIALLALLVLLAMGFAGYWFRHEHALRQPDATVRPGAMHLVVGFVTNFFDTLGIGSFAPTTSLFKLRRLVDDEKIPGTLNVGHAIPTVVQAAIFISVVEVDPLTLVCMIGAAVLGAWFGAGAVSAMPRRGIQIGMGAALLVAATLMVLMNAQLLPSGGTELQLSGGKLALAVAINFVLGAFMTLGIGLYAPCLILVSMLGMSPITAFPIMMGSCAFLMPVAALRFVRAQRYDLRAALGLTLAGLPGVLIAAFIVRSLPLVWLRWLVVVVAVYAASLMLLSAKRASLEAASTTRIRQTG